MATIFVRRTVVTVAAARAACVYDGCASRSIHRVLRPTRQPPRSGASVKISWFGGETELGSVCAVHDGGRRLEVLCEGGELLQFVLSPATAQFVAAAGGAADGASLQLLADAQGT